MTTEPMRPARIAGLALLGVAAVATVLGVVTLIGGNGDSQADQTPPPAATTTTAPPAASTTTSGQQPPATSAPAATTTKPPQASTTTTAPPPRTTTPGESPSTQDEPLRVYNNSTIKGLADKAKADLEEAGWTVVETGNHQGRVYVTTVYYRPGTSEEAAARALGDQFKLRVEPRFDGIADASPGVIVIVTKDWEQHVNDKG